MSINVITFHFKDGTSKSLFVEDMNKLREDFPVITRVSRSAGYVIFRRPYYRETLAVFADSLKYITWPSGL